MDHMCKFCNKIFPCGRSLGGHMRTHLITVPSPDHHHRRPKKKLPPLTNATFTKKPNRPLKSSEQDTLLEEKHCKECGKTFQSSKALFGHMKSHSDNSSSLNTASNYDDLIMDSQSDNEATPNPLLCRKKRSHRTKRYITNNNNNTNSSSISTSNFSPCVSEIDQQEQEQLVALSLILLSRDTTGHNNRPSFDSIVESSENSSKILDKNPQNSILDEFGLDFNKKKSRKRKSISIDEHNSRLPLAYDGPCDFETSQETEKKSKFRCVICKKGFSSYQALGGHRASHKKFKGLCDPTAKNSSEKIENSPNLIDVFSKGDEVKKGKDHECPICSRVFASGQALGGHKRSHVIGVVSKSSTNNNSPCDVIEKQMPEIRNFIDLNMPAPVEEECSDFKGWWIETSNEHDSFVNQ